MHLKLKINFRRLGGLAGWLLVLAEVATLSTLLAGARGPQLAAAQAPDLANVTQTPPQQQQQQQQQQQPILLDGRRCVPMLKFILPQAQQTSGARKHQAAQRRRRQQRAAGSQRPERSAPSAMPSATMPDKFAFAIQNIDMPLTQTGSPIQSAMRLLSSFDSSLGSLYGAADELEADASGERVGASSQPENTIRFERNTLYVSQFNLTMLNFHLYARGQPRFGLAVNIGNATLAGRFYYEGLAPALMGAELGLSKLSGHYRMTIDNVLLTASSNLTKRRHEEPSNAMAGDEPATYRLATNDFKMNVSNLGYISIDILDARDSWRQTSNYLLKMLQRVLQKTIKRTYGKFEDYIKQTLESEGRRFLDCELTRFSPMLRENQLEPLDLVPINANGSANSTSTATSQVAPDDATNNLDDLARILSAEIRNSQLDRVTMPNFEHQRSVLGSNALIAFTNGSLAGLDNVRLLGETRVKLQDEHLMVNASLGWFNLRTQYNWSLYLGGAVETFKLSQSQPQQLEKQTNSDQSSLNSTESNFSRADQDQQHLEATTATTAAEPVVLVRPMAGGFVGVTVRAVEFDTLIRRSLRQSQSRVTVDELNIRSLEGPRMELGGLPGMNRLTRATVNFLMARLKQRLVGSIQPLLKRELERALNRLALTAGE